MFSNQVKEFTEGASNIKCPDVPKKLSIDAVKFITKMVMSELHELVCTVSSNRDESMNILHNCLSNIDEHKKFEYDELDCIASQGDAMADIIYYLYNTSAKHGINLDKILKDVHDANMAKRDPKTNKFIIRETDGKIIKPDNWKEPDIKKNIADQIKFGAW
jgi:predicted HAD superfamily Cof-like phosphohydrolase